MVPLVYNKAQRYLYHVVQQMRLDHLPVRILALKARQVGISTGISSLVYHHAATRFNVNALVASHDMDSTDHIFRMYRLFYDKTDDAFRPMTRYSNRKELLFENPDDNMRRKAPGLNSSIRIDTAKNVNLGRSYTLHDVHLSEVAYMDNAKDLLLGVEEAVPNLPGTSIFLESTANGLGNLFHQRCERALKGKGPYRIVFIPWFWDCEYIAAGTLVGELGDHDKCEFGNELELVKKFNLNQHQILWRRDKIENSFDGSVQKFQQEYPSSPEEAFIFSGQPLFPAKTLLAMKGACEEPISRGEIVWSKSKRPQILPDTRGSFIVWKNPVAGGTYVLGADVAEGVEGGNNSSLDVLDVRTMEQVAHWNGIIHPEDFGQVIAYIGLLYGNALAGVEINNHGLTTVVALQNLKYWNQYRRITFDKKSKRRKDSQGWKTTAVTKPLIIDGLRNDVKGGDILINSPETIGEMLTYVKHDDGTLGAIAGAKDDRVMSMAIAAEMARQAFVRSRARRPRKSTKLTMSDVARMAEQLQAQETALPVMGSWRK